jgi:hypothetical protein
MLSPTTPIFLNSEGIEIVRVLAFIENTGSSKGKIEKYFYQYKLSPGTLVSAVSSFILAASKILGKAIK